MLNRLFAIAAACSFAALSAGCAASAHGDPDKQQQQPLAGEDDRVATDIKYAERKAPRCTVGSLMTESELVFGLSRASGPITEAEWQAFTEAVVTPNFPDGFSVIDVKGQYRTSAGVIIKEPSKLLLIYNDGSRETSRKLELIRTKYKEQFQQESVIRAESPICVSF